MIFRHSEQSRGCNAVDEVREARLSNSDQSLSITNGDRPEIFESLASGLRISLQRFAQHDNGIFKFGSQMLFVIATVILTSDL